MTLFWIVIAFFAILALSYALGELMGWPDPDGGLDVPDARQIRIDLQSQIDALQMDIAEACGRGKT